MKTHFQIIKKLTSFSDCINFYKTIVFYLSENYKIVRSSVREIEIINQDGVQILLANQVLYYL